jgi:hypothetical protein
MVLPLLAVAAGCGGDDDDDASAAGFCERARVFDEQFQEIEDQFEGEEVPTPDVFVDAGNAIEELADDAPGSIEDDLRTVADGVREIADVLEDIDVDLSDPAALRDPANAEAFQELGERMESLNQEVEGASNRVESYLADECGIDVDGEDDAGSDEELPEE